MSTPLVLHLSDDDWAALCRAAAAAGTTPEGLAEEAIQGRLGTPAEAATPATDADDPFERLFGNVDLGYPTGSDNESIDADLAREYARDHEES